MAHLGDDFDTETMDLGNDLLPESRYIAQIIEEVEKDTANGVMLTLTFEILDGQFEGRRFWERYNFINRNEDAQRIARKELGRLAKAIGVNSPDTKDFHHHPMMVDVIIRKGNNGYQDSNGVKGNGYHPVNGDDAPAEQVAHQNNPSTARSTQNGGSGATQQQAAPRAANAGGRPWDRNRRTA